MAKQKIEKQVAPAKPKTVVEKKDIRRFFPLIVFGFSTLIYFNSILNNYSMDDELVTQNHRLTSKGISAIPEIFRSPYYEDRAGYKYEYRPLVLVTFAIEHSIFGDNPHVSHFINVLLYGLLCLVLFNLLKLLFASYDVTFALLVTLVFAAHPTHTEVVASIKNRDETLALLFGLFSLSFAWQYAKEGTWWKLLLVPVMLLLGILAKSTTITFAILIPLTVILLGQVTALRLFLITLVLVLPSVFYSRLYSVTQQLLFVAAIFVAVFVLYLLRHGFNWQAVKQATGNAGNNGQEEVSEQKLDFSLLKSPLVAVSFFVSVVVVLAVALTGLSMGNMWLAVIPAFVLVGAFVAAKPELRFFLILPITIVVSYMAVRFQANTMAVEAILIAFLVSQYLQGNKQQKAMAIGSYLFYALLVVVVKHSAFPAAILLFAMFVNRRLWPLTAVLSVAALGFLMIKILAVVKGTQVLTISLASTPVLLLGILLLWRARSSIQTLATVIALPILLLLYFVVVPPSFNNDVVSGVQRTYYQLNTTKAADLNPVKSVRPLYYIENPVTSSDPVRLRIGIAMVALGQYLKMMLVPYPMSFYYGYAYFKPTDVLQAGPLIVLFVHIILLLAAFVLIRRLPLISYCIFFYLASIFVFSNLIIPVPGVFGDRFLLIPSIAFAILIVYGAYKLFKQPLEQPVIFKGNYTRPLQLSVEVLLVAYMVLTVSRNSDWKDHLTLFRHDIEVVGNSAQAQNLLAVHLFKNATESTDINQKFDLLNQASEHFKRAIEIYPQFLNANYDLGRSYYAIASLYSYQKNTMKASQFADMAYTQYAKTLQIDSTFVVPSFEMGVIMDNKGNLQQAIVDYERFLSKIKTQKEAYANLSYVYFRLGDYGKAIETNQRLLLVMPNTYEPTVNIAKTYVKAGIRDSAIIYFEKAYVINQNDLNVLKTLYQLAVEAGDSYRAGQYFMKLKERGINMK